MSIKGQYRRRRHKFLVPQTHIDIQCHLLKRYRNNAEYTLVELGDMLNIAPATINKIERGELKISYLELMQWIECCGVKRESFLYTLDYLIETLVQPDDALAQ